MPPFKTAKKPEPKFSVEVALAGDVNPWLRWYIHGRPKVGKTTFAASACDVPELSPVLVVSAGPGANTLRGEPAFKDVAIVDLGDKFENMNYIYDWLAPVEIGGQGHCMDYATIILDEFDDVHTMRMREVMAELVEKSPERDIDVPSMREFGQVRSQCLRIVDEFFKLPCHIMITGWSEYQPNPETGIAKLAPSLPGKLGSDIPGRVDFFVYFSVETPPNKPGKVLTEAEKLGVRIAHFQPSARYESGTWGPSRAKKLGSQMVDPSMAKVWAALYGAK